jgi:SulP family sulfate permease
MAATLSRWLPIAGWLPSYPKSDLRGDVPAGLTTAVMLIPQGMAYAMLAGLPPIVGLYASVAPLVAYAVFGSSRQLAVGPVAMVSLLVAAGVGPYAQGDAAVYLAGAVALSVLVGVLQVGMGVARLGFLTNFLSHPVLSGFTSAAAIIIASSQLKHLLGVKIPDSEHVHEVLWSTVQALPEVKPVTLGLGIASLVALEGLKRWKAAFPRALAVVVATTAAVGVFGLAAQGVSVVGEVPAGLPRPSIPVLDPEMLKALLPTAAAIALVGFMESIAVAQSFARRHKYDVDADQELVGLGMANLAGAAFGAYPVTGGFSRTAVNDQAGARTPLASMITAAVIAFALLFLTPLLRDVPKAVLAAIILQAVVGLIDVKEVKHLWKVDRHDLGFLVLTFGATLALGIEAGILTGAGASLASLIYRSTRPHLAVLGRVPGTEVYRNVKRPGVETFPGLLMVRMDAEMYFGNTRYLKQTLARLEAEGASGPLRGVVIDMGSVGRMDSSAAMALAELHRDYKERGVVVFLAQVRMPVQEVLERAHLVEQLGEEHIVMTVEHAVRALGGRPALRVAG